MREVTEILGCGEVKWSWNESGMKCKWENGCMWLGLWLGAFTNLIPLFKPFFYLPKVSLMSSSNLHFRPKAPLYPKWIKIWIFKIPPKAFLPKMVIFVLLLPSCFSLPSKAFPYPPRSSQGYVGSTWDPPTHKNDKTVKMTKIPLVTLSASN